MRRLRQQRLAAVLGACVLAGAACYAGEPDEKAAHVVVLERPAQSLDAKAPGTRFRIPDGQQLWRMMWDRALKITTEHGGGFLPASGLVAEEFRIAKGFTAEKYADTETGSELRFVISAAEVAREKSKIVLTRMKMVYFVDSAILGSPAQPPAAPGRAARAKKKHADQAAAEKKDAATEKERGAGRKAGEPVMGRVVVNAPRSEINLETNQGLATGGVTIEVFSDVSQDGADGKKDGASRGPVAIISSERLRWRTWLEPWSGCTELAVYTTGENEREADELVLLKYVMPQPDGANAVFMIEGRGLVYEFGIYDRPMPRDDEDGWTAGWTQTAHNRAVFRRDIRVTTTATGMTALLPFQPGQGPPEPNAPAPGAAKAAVVEPPSQTVLFCNGPAVLDLASVVAAKTGEGAATKSAAKGQRKAGAQEAVADDQKPAALARRLEFLNGVSVTQSPVEARGAAPGTAPKVQKEMSCRHLVLQYAAGAMPGSLVLPDYAEAVGEVRVKGLDPAAPFRLSCERIYYDGVNENMFLVGKDGAPVEVADSKGAARAEQFCYQRRTESLTMPSIGPKQLVIKPVAPRAAPDAENVTVAEARPGGEVNLTAAETHIEWNGALTREMRHLPVSGGQDRIKEVLILRDQVHIRQPNGKLELRGEAIRVTRSLPTGEVEFLEGTGDVHASMGELQARGDAIAVEMEHGRDGAVTKNLITVSGSRAKGMKATLFMGGSAVRAEKFVIDRLTDTLQAFGGAVAVVKSPPPAKPAEPKPQTALDAGGLFTGISFSSGGSLFMQCDGEFRQDGASRQVVIKGNVLIRQPEQHLGLLADEVYISLQDAPTAAPNAAGTPANQFFSGDLQSIDCHGNVELTCASGQGTQTAGQLVQCDRLRYDGRAEVSLLEMDDPANDVRIYLRQENGGTRILSARQSLRLDGNSGTFMPGGELVILPYRGTAPAPRGTGGSPARRKQ